MATGKQLYSSTKQGGYQLPHDPHDPYASTRPWLPGLLYPEGCSYGFLVLKVLLKRRDTPLQIDMEP